MSVHRTNDLAVVAEQLTRSFGATRALDGIDLELPAGSVLGLLGHNGAGKTTAIRILATLLTPTSGRATVCGHDVVAEPAAVRACFALAGQQATLDERLTGRENLTLLGGLQGLRRATSHARAREMLARFDLEDAADRVLSTYSGGMRRRLDLAACLMVPRPVVFLDEPTTGLDPVSRSGMWGAVRGLVDDGAALVLTTQYLDEADRLADRISVLAAGRVVAEGTPGELKDQVGGRRVELVLPPGEDLEAGAEALSRVGLDAGIELRERRLSAAAPEGQDDLARALLVLADDGIRVEEIGLRRPTLDDAFFALTGHQAPHEDEPSSPDGSSGLERRSPAARDARADEPVAVWETEPSSPDGGPSSPAARPASELLARGSQLPDSSDSVAVWDTSR